MVLVKPTNVSLLLCLFFVAGCVQCIEATPGFRRLRISDEDNHVAGATSSLSSSSSSSSSLSSTNESHESFGQWGQEAEDASYFGRELQMMVDGEAMMSMCSTPPPFDDSDVPKAIHVVLNTQQGEFFDLLVIGMLLQVLTMRSVELVVTSADGGTAVQRRLVIDAIDQGASGIITVGGDSESMCDIISTAIVDANIPVVSFDFLGEPCTPDHLLTSQADDTIASLVLMQVVDDFADTIYTTPLKVGYVTDTNFEPLIERGEVYERFKERYAWEEVLTVVDAAAYPSSQALQEAIEGAILEAEEDASVNGESGGSIDFIYAPWDYAALASLAATQSTGSGLHVFGADINDQDIVAMTVPTNSAWKATAGGDPTMMGAAIVRMSLLQIANDLQGVESITLPSFLLTQEFLLENNVGSLADLQTIMPEIKLDDIAQACWIESI